MELAVALSILSVVVTVLNFAFNRKDKAVKDTKELDEDKSDQKLINYRLGQVEVKLDKILDKLDSYDKEIDERVKKAIEQHIREYHREG